VKHNGILSQEKYEFVVYVCVCALMMLFHPVSYLIKSERSSMEEFGFGFFM